MNYRITIGGYRFKTYDECVKLLVHSAKQSDYIVHVQGFSVKTPVSPKLVEITLTGSSKKIYHNIALDFDGVFIDCNAEIILNPEIVGMTSTPDSVHYWALTGVLCKVIRDISPAYVTGYLLEENMKKELEVFTKFSNQLPSEIQSKLNNFFNDTII